MEGYRRPVRIGRVYDDPGEVPVRLQDGRDGTKMIVSVSALLAEAEECMRTSGLWPWQN